MLLPVDIRSLASVAGLLALLSCSSTESATPETDHDAGADGMDADATVDASADAEDSGIDVEDDVASDGEAGGPVHPCVSAADITSSRYAVSAIDPSVGEADYYRFSFPAGRIALKLSTSTAVLADFVSRDLVLSLLSGDGSDILATVDNGSIQLYDDAGRNQRMIFSQVGAVEDATYCLKVEHRWSWAGDALSSSEPCNYELSVEHLEPDPNEEEEPNDDVDTAVPIPFPPLYSAMSFLTWLSEEDPADVWSFDVESSDVYLQLLIPPSGAGGPGMVGSGSTLRRAPVELTDADGNVMARVSDFSGMGRISMKVPGGRTYYLWNAREASVPVGGNDFATGLVRWQSWSSLYYVKEFELSPGANDTRATAETPSPTVAERLRGVIRAYGNVHAHDSGDPPDVDYWAFDAIAGDELEVRCLSARIGSGVLDATFSIVDDEDNVLRSEVEQVGQDVQWARRIGSSAPPVEIDGSGKYYLRVSAGGQLPDVSSRTYECEIVIWPG